MEDIDADFDSLVCHPRRTRASPWRASPGQAGIGEQTAKKPRIPYSGMNDRSDAARQLSQKRIVSLVRRQHAVLEGIRAVVVCGNSKRSGTRDFCDVSGAPPF
jgi:hypothetical protein